MTDSHTTSDVTVCPDNKKEMDGLSIVPEVPPLPASLVEEARETEKEVAKAESKDEAKSWPDAGPVVLRVKRRVTEEPLPTLAIHAKKLRLQRCSGGGAAVFRLAGTLHQGADEAALNQAVSRVLQTSNGRARRPNRSRKRRAEGDTSGGRKRYRILGRVELSDSDSTQAGQTRGQKRKRSLPPGNGATESSDNTSGAEEQDPSKRSKCVHVFDVEFDSCEGETVAESTISDSYGPSLDEYRRQLNTITLNDEELRCTDASELMPESDIESDFVYDLYFSNAGPGDMVMTSDLGSDIPLEEDKDDAIDETGGWAFLLDGYDEDYNFPREYRNTAPVFEDADSDAESESNWRNEYPDFEVDTRECFSEEEFDLCMAGREPEASVRDSDDELRSYAYDDDLERGLRDMELSRGVEIREYDPEEDDEEDDDPNDFFNRLNDRRLRGVRPQLSKMSMQKLREDFMRNSELI